MARSNPTDKQERILAYVNHCDQPPTIEEIRRACGLSTKSLVAYHLKKLEEQGKLSIIGYLPRGIRTNA